MTYDFNGRVKNIVFWYCKNWYKSTGDIVDDFKIILNNIFYTDNWKERDVASILMNNFSDLIKDNLRFIIDESIFKNCTTKSEVLFIKSIRSLIAVLEVDKIEGVDETYKNMFNLRCVE